MNLEDLNLAQLDTQEVQETEGGRSWATFLYELADHWDDVKDGFRNGYNHQF